MARTRLSALRRFQRDARGALTSLRAEIRAGEAELQCLKREETWLRGIAGGQGRAAASVSVTKRGARLNWRMILKKVPKRFKAADLRKIPALRGKPPSEVYNGIKRWIGARLVKRKDRGLYERVGASRGKKSASAA
jgi:hypothetical protein